MSEICNQGTANTYLKVSNHRFASKDMPPKLDFHPDGHLRY